ncbi:hypothetical protein J9253_08540 [Thiothrix litoralis]|jgi:hypothetical protein|uniref:Uncharacterized protein n=1 Tax=Thiothrix litoralis TaxID=2891210 RepID=A0ABX7WX60_9GAMM|nr:hypothetical protein [Thiothrix litoralis]QTR47946.1 hypothetical protein J9253_08540 [Thiothrix litoralis]
MLPKTTCQAKQDAALQHLNQVEHFYTQPKPIIKLNNATAVNLINKIEK